MNKFKATFDEPVYYDEAIEPPTYRFYENGRRPWLQKFAFWLLSKTGADRTDMIRRVKHVTIDCSEERVHDLLVKAEALEYVYGVKPEVILVGPDMFYGILTDDELSWAISVNAQQSITITLPDGARTFQIYEFRIVLLPYMKGFLPVTHWRQMN